MSDLRKAAQAALERLEHIFMARPVPNANALDTILELRAALAQPSGWVGLTDDEIVAASEAISKTYRVEEQPSMFALRWARTIESALRAKNAAPEMLEALTMLLNAKNYKDCYGGGADYEKQRASAWSTARRAVAKATGKSEPIN